MKRKKRRRAGFSVSPGHKSQGRLFGETQAYLMGSTVYPFRNKFGISDRTDLRRAQVDKDVKGPVYTVFSRVILFAWVCEQAVHFLYQMQRAPMKKGTGRTEWFYTLNPVFGTALIWFSWHTGFYFWPVAYVLGYCLPFVWVDGLIWLLAFRLSGWGLAAGMAWAIYWILTK